MERRVSLFDEGDAHFKGAIHGALLVLCAQCAIYNDVVYRKRGGAWHLWSSAIYAAMCALEIVQIGRHLKEHR